MITYHKKQELIAINGIGTDLLLLELKINIPW